MPSETSVYPPLPTADKVIRDVEIITISQIDRSGLRAKAKSNLNSAAPVQSRP